jgi:hypothetical protein
VASTELGKASGTPLLGALIPQRVENVIADCKNMENAKWMTSIRESLYVPKLDLLLFNIFNDNKQVAYDPTGDRWATLKHPQESKRTRRCRYRLDV